MTAAQARWIASLAGTGVERTVCVLSSADHSGTRRNPLPVELREEMLRPVLEASGRPFALVRVDDIGESARWVDHVLACVRGSTGLELGPASCRVYTSNHEVEELFVAAGFQVVPGEVRGLTPHELVQRAADGRAWREEAAASTVASYLRHGVPERLRAIYAQRLLNDDGELGHAREFASYGAQMDAALAQKLEDLSPWVVPGRIVDKGCGTGKLLVELSRRHPDSAFVGVELSREFLRRCDENHYSSEDVTFLFGNAAERLLEPGSASTIVLSSVGHELYSYSGYDHGAIHRALGNACEELRPGGRLLIRDGVSPGDHVCRLRLLDTGTKERFQKFAEEFKRGQGAAHERISPEEVRLSVHLANEFLCKKDYIRNWHIEVHEEFGPLTADGYRQALERAGLTPIEIRAYVNPWIAENRYRGTVELFDDSGQALPWPATNVVAVGEKPM